MEVDIFFGNRALSKHLFTVSGMGSSSALFTLFLKFCSLNINSSAIGLIDFAFTFHFSRSPGSSVG